MKAGFCLHKHFFPESSIGRKPGLPDPAYFGSGRWQAEDSRQEDSGKPCTEYAFGKERVTDSMKGKVDRNNFMMQLATFVVNKRNAFVVLIAIGCI